MFRPIPANHRIDACKIGRSWLEDLRAIPMLHLCKQVGKPRRFLTPNTRLEASHTSQENCLGVYCPCGLTLAAGNGHDLEARTLLMQSACGVRCCARLCTAEPTPLHAARADIVKIKAVGSPGALASTALTSEFKPNRAANKRRTNNSLLQLSYKLHSSFQPNQAPSDSQHKPTLAKA